MSDLISRQAALDALKGLPTWWADSGGYYGGAQPPMTALLDPEDAVSAIENLPSAQPDLSEYSDKLWRNAYERGKRDAQPEQRWIPCSERLPENKSYVLTTIYVPGRQPHARSGWFEDGLFMNDNGDTWKSTDREVCAWMPLPEPYRGE